METGGAQHPSESATEAEASARAANLAMEADKNLTAMGADGEKPYSPSDPLDSDDQEKAMEWEASLPSIKHLYKQPHDTSEEGARHTGEREVVQELLPMHGPATEEVGSGSLPPNTEVTPSTATPTAATSMDVVATMAATTVGEGVEQQKAPVSERARLYLKKARDKMAEGVKARMGRDSLVYEAITASNTRATMATNLLGGNKTPAPQMTSLLDLADGQVMSGGLQLDMANKRVVCTSFSSDWTCFRCPGHTEPALKMRGAADSSGLAQAIIIADQSFPAGLPVSGSEGCMKIIIVENGSLKSLFEELVKRVGNRRLPKGSIMLAFSASHLLNVGLAQYAADLVEMKEDIQSKYGRETAVQPLPSIVLDGIKDETLIRSTMELIKWSDIYFSGDSYL
jgi:hypothetical protein